MVKSIGLLTVLAAAVVSAAFMPAGEEAGSCSGGKCGAAAATAAKPCGQCPATATSQDVAKSCSTGECAGGACSEGACKGCPGTTATSKDGATACAEGKCAGGACATTACSEGKSCAEGGSCTVATSKAGDGAACASSTCSSQCKDCPVTTAMKQLPQLAYQVGADKTDCPNAAAELAKKSSEAIKYVVADKSFDNEGEAKLALVETTEQFVAAFIEPKVCKESGNISVAGHKACCEGTAAQMSKVAKEAMDKVQMTYLVGEKSCHCPVEAEQVAKDSGEPTVFCVGEDKTACQVTARLNLARAKYRAAVVALMQAETATKPTSQDQQGS